MAIIVAFIPLKYFSCTLYAHKIEKLSKDNINNENTVNNKKDDIITEFHEKVNSANDLNLNKLKKATKWGLICQLIKDPVRYFFI